MFRLVRRCAGGVDAADDAAAGARHLLRGMCASLLDKRHIFQEFQQHLQQFQQFQDMFYQISDEI